MAQPNYDQLYQVQSWVSDPNSDIHKEMRSELADLEAKAATMDPQSKEYKIPNRQFQQRAAQLLLEKIQAKFGGKIPSQQEAADFDWARRGQGMSPEDLAALKAETAKRKESPYSNAYSVLAQLQKFAGGTTKAPVATPASNSSGPAGQAAPPSAAPKQGPSPSPKPKFSPQTEEEKLSEAQLMMLYGLSQKARGNYPTKGQVEDPSGNMVDPLEDGPAPAQALTQGYQTALMGGSVPASLPATPASAPAAVNVNEKDILENVKKMLRERTQE